MRHILSAFLCLIFTLFALISLNLYSQMRVVNSYLSSPVESAKDLNLLKKQKIAWQIKQKKPGNYIFWDATLSYQLGLKSTDQARYESNFGLKDQLYTESFNYHAKALSYRPVFSFALLEQVGVLHEQGAPVAVLLPMLDQVLKLSLKESDVRAIFALVCFQILSSPLTEKDYQNIKAKLKLIFLYSIDYRGQAHINAYAKLFSKQDLLKNIQAEVSAK